jgi:hypothetical protein
MTHRPIGKPGGDKLAGQLDIPEIPQIAVWNASKLSRTRTVFAGPNRLRHPGLGREWRICWVVASRAGARPHPNPSSCAF